MTKNLLWTKQRSNAYQHFLGFNDGTGNRFLASDSTNKATSDPFSDYTSSGVYYSQPISGISTPGDTYVAWNFRGAPKFFDIVTYEGFGSSQTISHELGSEPGMIIVKNLDKSQNWYVYHKENTWASGVENNTPAQNYLVLSTNGRSESSGGLGWEPTSTTFNAWGNIGLNDPDEYVAYLFADTPGLIKCGSYDGTANGSAPHTENCGFKPGWVLIKNTISSTDWVIYDTQRQSSGENARLYPNNSEGESPYNNFTFTDTGFTVAWGDFGTNAGVSEEYIYVAIAEDASAGQFMPTGVLTEDADKTNKQMTLTDVTGEWKPGLTAVNTEEVTENAPCGDDIVFTSSKPETTSGTVTTWGAADWELTNKDTNDTQTASVTLKGNVDAEDGPTTFTLEDDTNYSVRVQYSSADPAAGPSDWSDVNNFKTCNPVVDGWFGVEAPEASGWQSVTYGNNKFVAVASGGAKQIMWAEDPTQASSWKAVTAPGSGWYSVTYGDGKFVAVAYTGTNRIMWADENDLDTWTAVAAPEANSWYSVTYGDGKFVAIAFDGTSRIMWAEDPTKASDWKTVTAPEQNQWRSVTYGNNKFVAVAADGTSRIMWAENPAGPWAAVAAPEASSWRSVIYENNKFVAVASGGAKQIMYAEDPTQTNNWKALAAPEQNQWYSVTYGDGKFVAVADYGNNRIMYATDPTKTWTTVAAPEQNQWRSVTYGDGKFVSVADLGTNRVMYSFTGTGDSVFNLFYDENNAEAVSDVQLERRYGVDANDTDLRDQGIYSLTEQPDSTVDAYVKCCDEYKPIQSYYTELQTVNAELETARQSFAARVAALEAASTPTEPFAIDGYYPLYSTEAAANAASSAGTSHSHTLNGTEYYMPNGGTIYHGNYNSY